MNKLTKRILCAVIAAVMIISIAAVSAVEDARSPVCGLAEHIHTQECYESGSYTLNCDSGHHIHTPECFNGNGNIICGYADYLIHHHSELCAYGCGLADSGSHIHTSDCFDETGALICTQKQSVPHTHSAGCFNAEGRLICCMVEAYEHQHTDECLNEIPGQLICTEPEHIHAESCSTSSGVVTEPDELTFSLETVSGIAPQNEDFSDNLSLNEESSSTDTADTVTDNLIADDVIIDASAEGELTDGEITPVSDEDPSEIEELQDDETEIQPMMMLAAANNAVSYTGYGVRNNYLYDKLSVRNDYNYSVADSNGNWNLAFCFNQELAGPEGTAYTLKYQNATNDNFLSAATNENVWSWQTSYFQNTIYWIIYYGYPYNSSSRNYLKEAVTTYGIPEDYAEEAFRFATQAAIWYMTNSDYTIDGKSLDGYKGVTSGKYAVYGLAYAIYEEAWAASGSAPAGMQMDIYSPASGNRQNLLVVRNTGSPVVPSVKKLNVSGTKTWDDAGYETLRPESITVSLHASYTIDQTVYEYTDLSRNEIVTGNKTQLTQNVAGTGSTWSYTFENLPMYYDGHLLTYYVEEEPINNYTSLYDGMNIKNTRVPGTVPVTPAAVCAIKAKKTFDGEAPGDRVFTFGLYDQATGTLLQTAQNDSSGNIAFESITYYQADTYLYTVKEINDKQDGVVYDDREYTVTVTVSSKDLVNLSYEIFYGIRNGGDYGYYVSSTKGEQDFPVYCIDRTATAPGNTASSQIYHAVVDPDNSVLAQYVPDNRWGSSLAYKMKQLFYYIELHPEIYDADTASVTQQMQYKKDIVWEFCQRESGRYDDPSSPVRGFSFDMAWAVEVPANYHLVLFMPEGYDMSLDDSIRPQPLAGGYGAKVDTALEASVNEIVFENTSSFPAADTPAAVCTVKAVKTIDGNAPGDKVFTFVLCSKDDITHPLQTAHNDKDGNIVFEPIYYSKPGTYEYQVFEVDDGQAGIKYDTNVYSVTVVVQSKDLVDLSADAYYGIAQSGGGYYVSAVNGQQDFPVFCIDRTAKAPSTTTTNQKYHTLVDPDTSVLSQYIPENRWGDSLAYKMRQLFYYLETHPEAGGDPSTGSIYEANRKSIVWDFCGTGSGYYDDPTWPYNNFTYSYAWNTVVPDSYHLILFVPEGYDRNDSNRPQPLAGGYGAKVSTELTASVNRIVFSNTTVTVPQTIELPDTGGTGTLMYTLSGLSLILTAAMYKKTSAAKRKGRATFAAEENQ